jgi:hypothetical protein
MSEKELPKIKDIAKFKKMREQMEGFKLIKKVLPFANPFLNILGVNTNEMKGAIVDFDRLEKEFIELSELPDKFNDALSSRGFIIFDSINPEVAIEASRIAETDVDEAEKFLINHFTPEIVETYLYMMNGVKAFRPRMDLAEKALIDYKEERYHACIPVILALMDGLVNELNRQQNRSFFAEGSDLRAWDCITAHEKGLNSLKEVLHVGRYKTTTEEISIPYRNGILHGMDLGYANKTVAAKTWAALFAVRDWAIKAESKALSEPPPEPPPTWEGIFNDIKNHSEWKKSFEQHAKQWKPRLISIGEDIPKTGVIEDFQIDTPERKLIEFLVYWKKKNYGKMADCIWSYLQLPGKQMAGRVRQVYGSYFLIGFELLEIIDEAPSVTEIRVLLTCESNGNSFNKEVRFRLVVNDGLDNKPLMRGMPNSTWGVVNWGHGN